MSDADRLAEAAALDDAVLATIAAWARDGTELDDADFTRLALRCFAFQVRYNPPYRRFAAAGGFDEARLPPEWRAIPAIPAGAFKERALCTFDPQRAALTFQTSGTTAGRPGTHCMESARLYDAALLAGFDRFMLADGARLRYLLFAPNPRERPHSSLGYMLQHVAEQRGDGRHEWFLGEGDELRLAEFLRAAERAIAQGQAVCVAGTAFAFVHLLDELQRRALRFALPAGSRVMETGGFKGRSRAVERAELYARLIGAFGLPGEAVAAEYGMTELTSQYYDSLPSRTKPTRVKTGPPWLKALVVDERGREVARGTVGLLRHFDLANRSSVLAIETEDLALAVEGGFVLLGREARAELRGCSLDAEELRVAAG